MTVITGASHFPPLTQSDPSSLQTYAYATTGRSLSKQAWIERMRESSPMFQNWDEWLGFCQGTQGEKLLSLYLDSLKEIVPLFFALNMLDGYLFTFVIYGELAHITSLHNEFHEHRHWVVHKKRTAFQQCPLIRLMRL